MGSIVVHFIVSIFKKFNLIPVPILDVQPAICFARALIEANQLGVFTVLENSGKGLSSDEVTQRIGIFREGASILLKRL